MKISVDLIPHTDFHKGLWLQSNQSPWYFFYNSPREYTLPKDSKFYKTVDDDLLDIVKLLHSKKIPTTPSCSGHIMSRKHYSDLYNTINVAKDNIVNDGIILKNPETGRRFFYKHKNYDLPWSKNEFLNDMEEYQKKGVIGFVDNNGIYDELKGRLPVKHDNGITLIFSKGNSEDSISKNWNNVYKLLNKHF